MMESQGERLKRLRLSAGLSQDKLAETIGVWQAEYSRWELDRRPIPESQVHGLAVALNVDDSVIAEARISDPVLEGAEWPHRQPECPRLPPYEVKGTLEQVLAIGTVAENAFRSAQRRVPRSDLALIVKSFPRDSENELLGVLHLLGMKAQRACLTLASLRCPALVTDGHGSARTGQHYRRDALVLVRNDVSLVMVPQVWVASVVQSEWYRLDFLTLVRLPDARQAWVDVEIDGQAHELMRDRDERRTRGIGLPRRGLWVSQVRRPDFGDVLLATLKDVFEPQSIRCPNRRRAV